MERAEGPCCRCTLFHTSAKGFSRKTKHMIKYLNLDYSLWLVPNDESPPIPTLPAN